MAGPEIAYKDGELTVRFMDYTEQPREIRFHDASSYRYCLIEADERRLCDDAMYVVDGSDLIRVLAANGEFADPEIYTHYILCFNEAGRFLEVVARSMTPECG